jgi:hypothetical protein
VIVTASMSHADWHDSLLNNKASMNEMDCFLFSKKASNL